MLRRYRFLGRTYEGNGVVNDSHDEANNSKVENVSPVGKIRILIQLVVGSHDTSSHEVGKHETSKVDEDVLGDEAPWRMTCSKEGRLLQVSVQHAFGLGMRAQ